MERFCEAKSAARTVYGHLEDYRFTPCPNCSVPCSLAPNGQRLYKIIPFTEIAEEKIEYDIEGHVTRGGLNLVSALPKCGKSFSLCNMAVCLASGKPLYGKFQTKKVSKILLVNPEDSPGAITRARLGAFARHLKIDEGALQNVVTILENISLDQPENREALEKTVAAEKVEVLMLDPFIRFSGAASIRNENEVGAILDFLRHLTRKFGITVIFAHHEIKNREAYAQRESLSLGSVNFAASRDTGIYITRTTPDREPLAMDVEISHRHSLGMEYGLRLKSTGSEKTHELFFEMFDSKKDKQLTRDVKSGKAELAVFSALKNAKEPLSKRRLIKVARREAKLSQGDYDDLIDEMIDSGKILKNEKNRLERSK